MTDLEQWKNDIYVYNEEYEKVLAGIRETVKKAKRLLHQKKPTAEIADELVNVTLGLQKLVDLNAEAGYNYRGIKGFYERTLISRKLDIMRAPGEKKVAANVAEGEAVIESQEEFALMNEAERYQTTCEKRYEATKELVASLRTKLEYGYKP